MVGARTVGAVKDGVKKWRRVRPHAEFTGRGSSVYGFPEVIDKVYVL